MSNILLDAGSGGRASHRLISELFMKHFDNPELRRMNDAAFLPVTKPLAMSTDSYTVSPLFFNGADIGKLAVHGTVNDVSMLGAKPLYLSAAFIIEEGFDYASLERIVISMADACREAGVLIVTGDTKVVPKGTCDKIFINTTGIGEILTATPPSGERAVDGDAILISGTMGDHGITIMSAREQLSFVSDVASDSTNLNYMIEQLVLNIPDIHVLRDPTRGGLATTLGEIALQSALTCKIMQDSIPVNENVRSACSVLGLDPLYLANEGKLICILPQKDVEEALKIMNSFPQGTNACQIGQVLTGKSQVQLQTSLGGIRLLPMLEGAQLPRIC